MFSRLFGRGRQEGKREEWQTLAEAYLKTIPGRYSSSPSSLEERRDQKFTFRKPYWNEFLIEMIAISENRIKKEIQWALMEDRLTYDDLLTIASLYFLEENSDNNNENNQNNKNHFRDFIRPFYQWKEDRTKDRIDSNILKAMIHIFLFHLLYLQLYFIASEWMEVGEEDLRYYLTLFLKSDKKMREEAKREIHLYYLDFYITSLFTLYFRTIHLLSDISPIHYSFDIHDITLLKQKLLGKIIFS